MPEIKQNSGEKRQKLFCFYEGVVIIPGIIRLRDAPYYLGMNKTFFRDSVQPYLTRIPIDKRGIGFSRVELDCWIAYTKATVGQPPKKIPPWETVSTQKMRSSFLTEANSSLPVKEEFPMPEVPTPSDLDKIIKKTIALDKSQL